ncbi:exodeoxyribonuclease VII small subunit [Methanococcoides burtonii]|uniref:Exodeoxyribonuclease VII, small subunit n=1 Tax=Methanococcoides burtonii (strain DSM 6242 / NBRC 107633 / OCM 468 / ACE-M) TaxID=259564 RepID=Q12VV5_METBU|nr:exodeoxyribonuclease VII small subunit [Methanococcoides burtonii]ABE52421.1 Exodeoxyribonuclease VII, small subunit [Methanococcoides burtonii DSM 6242]
MGTTKKAKVEKGAAEKEQTFEASLGELEHLVDQLEKGQLTLDESIETFEKGMKLALLCNQMIEDSEKKVEVLMEKSGKLLTGPFNEMGQ